ncbi:MAG TPA: hypothetical protein VIQ54_22685, partial [Polyangia bacterium]
MLASEIERDRGGPIRLDGFAFSRLEGSGGAGKQGRRGDTVPGALAPILVTALGNLETMPVDRDPQIIRGDEAMPDPLVAKVDQHADFEPMIGEGFAADQLDVEVGERAVEPEERSGSGPPRHHRRQTQQLGPDGRRAGDRHGQDDGSHQPTHALDVAARRTGGQAHAAKSVRRTRFRQASRARRRWA